jgi:metallo-beta-lactamase class B
VYVVIDSYPISSNSMVIAMADSEVLLLDTPWTPDETELLLKWIDKRFGHAKITAINTHYHSDRLGGNAALTARGIPIYGSDHTAKLLAEKGEQSRQAMMSATADPKIEEWCRSLRYVPPDHLFKEKDGLVLHFGEETVEVHYPGPGHTPDNLIVYCPSKEVLFGGCAIIGMEKLGNMAEADPKSWLAFAGTLSSYDAQVVVPGHGGDSAGFSPALLDNTIRLLTGATEEGESHG